MVQNWLAAAVFLLAACSPALASDRDKWALEKIRNEHKVPGLAAAIIRDKGTQKAVVGYRKLGDRTRVRITDKFHIGSNTKAMTGTLIALLIDQGHFNWTSTLPEVLPDEFQYMVEDYRNTTVGMLGSHHSGISEDLRLDTELVEKLYDPSLTPREGRKMIMERILKKPLSGTPGQYVYDNINYILLGTIIENFMSGNRSWEEIAEQELFRPLGMGCGFGPPPESTLTSIDNPWGHLVQNLTVPPTPVGGESVPMIRRDNPPALGPAGTVHCDIKSHSKFIKMHLDAYKGKPIPLKISQETFKYLHTPYPSTGPTKYTYGGWVYLDGSTTPWSKGPLILHDGSNIVFYALSGLAPKLGNGGIGFISLTNIGNSVKDGTKPADEAAFAAVEAMAEGRIFPLRGSGRNS
ncbi:hypothetical protein FQN57_001474 [Myotisia sp. PD_48]|nr:hypothetical protein FQN57_001474 [Myotisia sp. PD_48]